MNNIHPAAAIASEQDAFEKLLAASNRMLAYFDELEPPAEGSDTPMIAQLREAVMLAERTRRAGEQQHKQEG